MHCCRKLTIAEQAFDVLEFIGSNFEQFETEKASV
jgi:hypothetical protein